MVDVKISELTPAGSAHADDRLEASQVESAGFVSRSITLDQVTDLVAASDQIADIVATGGGGRPQLEDGLTLYVRSDGSDANDGMADAAAGAFLTWHHAVEIARTYDFNGHNVIIKAGEEGAPRTFTLTSTLIIHSITGSGDLVLRPSSSGTTLTYTGGILIQLQDTLQQVVVGAFTLNSGGPPGTYGTITVFGKSTLVPDNLGGPIWGTATTSDIWIHDVQALALWLSSTETIAAGKQYHVYVSKGQMFYEAMTCTIPSPISMQVFATCTNNGYLQVAGVTFVNPANVTDALRFYVNNNSTIATGGAGANCFPGQYAGIETSGGIYSDFDTTRTGIEYHNATQQTTYIPATTNSTVLARDAVGGIAFVASLPVAVQNNINQIGAQVVDLVSVKASPSVSLAATDIAAGGFAGMTMTDIAASGTWQFGMQTAFEVDGLVWHDFIRGRLALGLGSNFLVPGVDNTYTLGSSFSQWADVRAVLGHFTGNLSVTGASGSGVDVLTDGWLSIEASSADYGGIQITRSDLSVDQRLWYMTNGGSFTITAATDAYAPVAEWTFARNGSTTLPGALTLSTNGAAATPVIARGTSGLYFDGANGSLYITTNGTQRSQFDTGGNLWVTGGVLPAYCNVGAAGAYGFSTRGSLTTAADGRFQLANNANTAGVTIDVTTNGTFKFRDYFMSVDAPITAASATFSGTVTGLSGTAVGAGANTQAFVKASSTANLGIYYGTGDPSFSAAKGSLYSKTDATTTTTRLWVNTNGSTTWATVTTSA